VHEIKDGTQRRHGEEIGPCFLSGEDPDITSLPEESPRHGAEERAIRTPPGDRQVFAHTLGRQNLPESGMNREGGEFTLFECGCPCFGGVRNHNLEAVTRKGGDRVQDGLAILERSAPGGFGIQEKA